MPNTSISMTLKSHGRKNKKKTYQRGKASWLSAFARISYTLLLALFSFLYLKKQNFKNICRIGKFSKIGACRPGCLSPIQLATGPKCKKNLYLGPGAQGALNSELVKSI